MKLLRKGISLIFLCLSTTGFSQIGKTYQIEIDTLSASVQQIIDSTGNPTGYFTTLFTPVCKTGECLPVTISLKWDLLGNFTGYEMPPGEILTKFDHEEFSTDDYNKFGRILANENSILEDFEIEMMKYTLDESVASVDGVSGATPKSIQASVVEGAVYTCYTIWQIVHKIVRPSLREITDNTISTNYLKQLLNTENFAYQRYALKQLINRGEISPVLNRYDVSENPFELRLIIENLPRDWLVKEGVQIDLWEKYFNLSFKNRTLLAMKFQDISVSHFIADIVEEAKFVENSEQMERLMKIYKNSSIKDDIKNKRLKEMGY